MSLNRSDPAPQSPIAYRGYTARAARDARPELFIEVQDFLAESEAREWVEVARRLCLANDFCSFACCVVAIFPKLDREAAATC